MIQEPFKQRLNSMAPMAGHQGYAMALPYQQNAFGVLATSVGIDSGKALKTTQLSRDRTIGLHRPNLLVTNSHYSPCQLPAESGTWWQDSLSYGKG
jgi:hypothetical protein